jgi:hypothetical protein
MVPRTGSRDPDCRQARFLREQGPAIRAIEPWVPGSRRRRRTHQLLTGSERARLAAISSVLQFKRGAEITVRETTPMRIFNVITCVVKVCTQGPRNDELVRAFLFSEDLIGFAQVRSLRKFSKGGNASHRLSHPHWGAPSPILRR